MLAPASGRNQEFQCNNYETPLCGAYTGLLWVWANRIIPELRWASQKDTTRDLCDGGESI
jgi:hypothetical protein